MALEVPHRYCLAQLRLQLQFQWSLLRLYGAASDGLEGNQLCRPRCLFPRQLLIIRCAGQRFIRDCSHCRRLLLEDCSPTLPSDLPSQDNKLFQTIAKGAHARLGIHTLRQRV